MQHFELAHEGQQEELREKYRQVAFNVWMSSATEDGPNFIEFLEDLGLNEQNPGAPARRQRDMDVTKEQALEKAADIMAMFSQGYTESHNLQ